MGNGSSLPVESQDPKVSIKLKAWPGPGRHQTEHPWCRVQDLPDLDAAWADLQAGNLDVLDTIPDSGLVAGQ